MVEKVNTYTAVCRRSGNWWAVSIRELKGVHTQARRLDQVADMALDAIALMLDVDPAEVQVTVEPEVPAPVTDALAARRAAREAEHAAEAATATAVRQLLDNGYTIRDAGRLLGLSPQRISQIAPKAPRGHQGRAAA
jgi:predicted RNase H-like HicB family nuclease